MTDPNQLQRDIYDFRLHLDQIYLNRIPRLLDDKDMFLAFLALPLGFVDVKVCAIDETWSGLKLVVRKELR